MAQIQEKYGAAARQRLKMKDWIPFLNSNRIRYYIQQYKKLYYEQYCQEESKLMNQLSFAMAVESKENPRDLQYTGLQHLALHNIRMKLRDKEIITENDKELLEFIDLQYKHMQSLKNKDINQSPYYQDKGSLVQQFHSTTSLDLMNWMIELLRKEQHFMFVSLARREKTLETPVDDHLAVLQMIHMCYGKEYDTITNEQQLTQRKENQSRKYSNLETAIELRKSYEIHCANVKNNYNKNKQNNFKTASKNIGVDKLPLTPQQSQQNKLENLSIKQLIKEYKSLLQQTNKDNKDEVARYLEVIFSKAQKDETTLIHYRNEIYRDKQAFEEELEKKTGEQVKENLELRKKIEEIINENKELKLKLTSSQQMEERLDEKLEEEKQKNIKLEKSLNKMEKDYNEKQHQKIKELNEEIQKLQEQQTKTTKLTKEKKIQTELKSKTVGTQTIIKTKSGNTQTDVTFSDPEQQQTIELQQISNRLQNIEKIIMDHNNLTEKRNLEVSAEVEHDKGDQTSNSALIIKITSKNFTLTQLKESLNERLLSEESVPPVFCKQAKQRNTLILQSNNDNNTEQLLRLIENYSDIKQKIEITYKLTKNSKVIITGIPLTVSSSAIISFITEQTKISNIAIDKILQREKTNNYHIVLNMEFKEAQLLLHKKFLLIGLNTCHIRLYRPIIRCGNCQLYGHSAINCLRDSICAKCSRGHHTSECPYALDSSQHRCTNCYQNEGYRKHTADSNLCPVFRSILADRRTPY